MKTIIILLFLLLVNAFNYPTFGQDVVFEIPKDIKSPNRQVRISFLVGVGFINPNDVNRYIQDYINTKTAAGYYFSYGGSSDISVEASFNIAVVVPVGKNIQLKLPLEYGAGFKQVTIDTDTKLFTMNRFAPGAIAGYYFQPENTNTIFLGAGLLYNFMWFEGYSASGLSPRFELGYRIQGLNTDWEFLIMADLAKGSVHNQDYNNSIETINFSGILFGIRFIF